ncbi:MAG: hypothetical protein KTR16_09835 [Acidiferrobacterales bacterium]|nr:hypothetical protein [Acidiferrobacterales bacterium]
MKKQQSCKPIKIEYVYRLSRGKRSGINIGSRSVGHYLKPYEQRTFERALKNKYLEITDRERHNLWHIWEKACQALEQRFIVLVKELDRDIGKIYIDGRLAKQASLPDSKKQVRQLCKV